MSPWWEIVLRRFGVIMLVLCLPGLVLPVVGVVDEGLGEIEPVTLAVIALAYVASVAMYGALAFFTIRAYRR